jgi:alpha-N-arabinofuranosidase
MYRYRNPVIPGFHPDPSICRDGEDYYLVTSTFEFFPGVPVYHSRNLANWELSGYCLSRNEQLPLAGCKPSGGIFAPTLRKQGSMFFMTTTNVSGGGNLIVHAQDVRGPWSEPVYVDQEGIDPSLLFADGKAYFCSTGREGGRSAILLCEIDPLSGKKHTPSQVISRGCGGKFPEAPHLYLINGWYYLMLAEGGTEYGHMVTMQRSRSVYGPYESCPHNPILTHRNRSGHPIQALGHADIVEDHQGNWWMVCLGIRPLGWAMLHNLGRETFLLPLRWDGDWPRAGIDGTIEAEMEAPLPAAPEEADFSFAADFSLPSLDPHWNFVRNLDASRYRHEDGLLCLEGNGQDLSTPCGNPVFLGIRQQAFEAEATATLAIPRTQGKAGISAYYNQDYHYEIFVERSGTNMCYVVLKKRVHDIEVETFRRLLPTADEISLRIAAEKEDYIFSYSIAGDPWVEGGRGLTAGLCTEGTHTMTFTGVYVGLFCIEGAAYFKSFALRQ